MADVLTVNASIGAHTLFHYDDDTQRVTLEEVQDTGAIEEHAKQLLNGAPDHFRGEMVKVATIPLTVLMDLQQKGITRDPKAFAKWLNDRDNLVFRTHGGKV